MKEASRSSLSSGMNLFRLFERFQGKCSNKRTKRELPIKAGVGTNDGA